MPAPAAPADPLAPPVVIVGAGVAGLTTALALARAGRPVRVLEREPEPGGRVRSRREQGYTLDRGFQVLFTAYPTLAAELAGGGGADAGWGPLALREFAPAGRIVTAAGASLVGDPLRAPFRHAALLPATVFAGALSTADKLRLLALRGLARSLSVDDCFAARHDAVPARAFLRDRGFSDRTVARFFAPFYGGILLDPALGTSAAVLLFTFKMLAEGATAVPAAGMGAVAGRLAARLEAVQPGALRPGAEVAAVRVDDGRVCGVVLGSGEVIDAADVVLAGESPAAARLAATAGVRLAVPEGALGCTTVWFAAPGDAAGRAPLPGRAIWLNAAGHERAAAGAGDAPAVSHAVTMTEVAPEYAAPDAAYGRHLVAATAVGEAAALPDSALVARMRADLAAMRASAGLDAAAPALVPVAVDRVPYAQFAQPPGARARRTPASAGLPGLWRASETAHSSSLEGAARGGALAAAAILAERQVAAHAVP
jgi:phytoene dehydrogenase-like protein